MLESNFYYKLAERIKGKDCDSANAVVMDELGGAIASDKKSFIDVLRSAGIEATDDDDISTLVNQFIANAPHNDKLLLGVSILLGHRNKVSNSDGESELSDTGIKATYKVMYEYFDAEPTSNWVGAIAKAVGSGADLGAKIVEGKNQKKYGAQIQLGKQQEARSQMIQSILAKKQQEAQFKEDKKKRMSQQQRIILIGSIVVVASFIGLGIYLKFKKK
jgi:hypothetical protein